MKMGLRTVIHGDDITVLGTGESLDWFRKRIKEKFEVKFRARLGPDKEDDKSVRILNRIVEWTPKGIRYEANQTHAEIIVRATGVHKDKQKTTMPGRIEGEKDGRENDEEEMEPQEASKYRALTARANYRAQDRSDIRFATCAGGWHGPERKIGEVTEASKVSGSTPENDHQIRQTKVRQMANCVF